MKKSRFKPGEKVRHRNSGILMKVVKYPIRKVPLIGDVVGRSVECVWYENGQRKKALFDERVLSPVYTDFYNSSLFSMNSVQNFKQF